MWDGRDWGAARLIRRDALSLVRFLTERVASDADLRNRIAADPTISADVRSLALALSRDFWEARVRACERPDQTALHTVITPRRYTQTS